MYLNHYYIPYGIYMNPANPSPASTTLRQRGQISIEVRPMKQKLTSSEPTLTGEPEFPDSSLTPFTRFVQVPFDFEAFEEEGDMSCDKS
jgi:hypothetical protein